jgi:hypothetical protein
VMLPLSMEKTADDPCPLYHYLVVDLRGSVRFLDGVGSDITRRRSVPSALSKRSHLKLKNDPGSRIFLDIHGPHGVQKRNFTAPDCTNLTPWILSLRKTPTEVIIDKEPADAGPTFLPLLRGYCKSYDIPI